MGSITTDSRFEQRARRTWGHAVRQADALKNGPRAASSTPSQIGAIARGGHPPLHYADEAAGSR